MTEEIRQEIVAALVLRTGWNESAFVKLSDRELLELYDRYVN